MKKISSILSVISALLALIISFLPISNLAIFPAIFALIFVLIAYFLSKPEKKLSTTLKISLFAIALSLVIISYKAFFTTSKVESKESIEKTEKELEKESLEELEELEINE